MEMRVRNQSRQQQYERHPRSHGFKLRRGFTLLELMVAIVVISILAAFLLPAIQGVIRSSRVAAVRNEISQLEAAIANFKATYGIEPPSRIVLPELASEWSTADVASKAIIQRMWPNFDFASNQYDWDTNNPPGQSGVSVTLTGSECLVFFLGGILQNGAPQGFSKNPANPFSAPTGGESRQGPFFDFVPSRLKQSTAIPSFLVYVDSIPNQLADAPYLYLSSYEGKGYSFSTVSPPSGYLWYNPDGGTRMARGYFSTLDPTDATKSLSLKPKSFQIISPGEDGRFGAGGAYDASLPNSGLTENVNRNLTLEPEEDLNANMTLDLLSDDFDNISNFASGRLVP